MNLTDYFYSLNDIDKPYNKYASYSLAFNNRYKIASSFDAFKYDKFDSYIKQFIAEQGKCIAMPSFVKDEVISLMFRSISSKQFRYYTECKNIPYGAGVNEKPYYKPWIIVESALDADFLRNFYPFVIATNGTAVSNSCIEFLKGTCSTVYCGFDMDEAGNKSFKYLSSKYSGSDKDFHIKRFCTPKDFNGNYLKDFGEILDRLHSNNIDEYDYYVSFVKNSMLYI